MGIFENRLFGTWKPKDVCRRTIVTPKKGMLVCTRYDWDHCRIFGNGDTEKIIFLLIIDSICDEYGDCKFSYLEGTKIKWADWMPVWLFNRNYKIKNPWI